MARAAKPSACFQKSKDDRLGNDQNNFNAVANAQSAGMFAGGAAIAILSACRKRTITHQEMKAISNSKYEHLQGAMEELACLLQEQKGENTQNLNKQITEKREQLKGLYKHYSEMLGQLEHLTQNYEELAMDIRMNLLGKHLKAIKKQLSPGCPGYQHFGLSVQLLYGT
jgi:succinate dehydrogenase/fumarate reductase flavoprotein subunit